MATQVKPTMANSPRIKVGKNRDNKPADAYSKPHDMSGKAVDGEIPKVPYATEKAAKDVGVSDPMPNGVSYGTAKLKTDGITMRGYGAAIKGIKSRGPMA
jgi:hypothetical protein